MFDIGFQELLMIAVIALLVMGPERLPSAIRTTSLWIGKFRRGFQNIKHEIEQEIGADEIRRQLHNETIMNNLEKTQRQAQNTLQQSSKALEESIYDVNDIFANPSSASKPSQTPSADHPSKDHKPT